jgi:hypothetical protein
MGQLRKSTTRFLPRHPFPSTSQVNPSSMAEAEETAAFYIHTSTPGEAKIRPPEEKPKKRKR